AWWGMVWLSGPPAPRTGAGGYARARPHLRHRRFIRIGGSARPERDGRPRSARSSARGDGRAKPVGLAGGRGNRLGPPARRRRGEGGARPRGVGARRWSGFGRDGRPIAASRLPVLLHVPHHGRGWNRVRGSLA